MLVRGSRRKLLHDARRNLQPPFEQIHLPWLCPAFFICTTNRPRKSTYTNKRRLYTAAQPSPRHQPLATPPAHRGLAYAAHADGAPHDEYIPFETPVRDNLLSSAADTAWPTKDSFTGFTFDPVSPLILRDSLAEVPRRIRVSEGVGGYLTDIHETLSACLQVGRLDRAAATIRRLNSVYRLDAPTLIETHNEYIGSLVERIVRTKDQQLLQHVQKWFEVDLCGKGIVPNPTTIALMIRAALQEANQLKIDRTIRRYLALANQQDIKDEVMAAASNILNEQDVGRVTRVPSILISKAQTNTSESFSHATSTDDNSLISLEDYPIRPTKLKGFGLETLQKSLSMFSEQSSTPSTDIHDSPELSAEDSAFIRQLRLEEDTVTSAIDRWRKEHTLQMKQSGAMGARQSIGSLMWQWHEALVPLIKEEIRVSNDAESGKLKAVMDRERVDYGPFLQFLTVEQLSALTILSILSGASSLGIDRGIPVTQLVIRIGNAVQDESLAQSIKKHTKPQVWKGLNPREHLKRLHNMTKRLQPHDSLAKMVHEAGRSDFKTDSTWSNVMKTKVGAVLISHFLKAAKMEVRRQDPDTGQELRESQPVYWTTYEYKLGKRIGVFKMNRALREKLSEEPPSCAIAKYLPMIVEPVPWTGFRVGGFIRSPVNVVRLANLSDQNYEYIRAASRSGDMDQMWAGLDILGKTPWKINRKVFEVMAESWNTGEAIANIAPACSAEMIKEESDLPIGSQERKTWERQVRVQRNARAGLHSKRCFQNFQMEVARAYLNETLYFPHNVDFRGRAYPIPPYLNHMGADNCRGLLTFAKGKELGTDGLVWLKIHLANVFGFDKASLQERQEFTENHLAEISDSATNSLGGNRWWLEAEDPWQCLAACIELMSALDCKDPTKYVSHLPIHQDGTCNGLQHYAALGGDSIGAKQVNLEPGSRPSDVYTGVAEMIQREIAAEADQGDKLALVLNGKVTRKVVKRTVMTSVYGVTFRGASEQVVQQLQASFPDFPSTIDINPRVAGQYVARKILTSLSTMFDGAHAIQFWLGECATRICDSLAPEQMQWMENSVAGKNEGPECSVRPTNTKRISNEHTRFKSTVIWTTPLGMPVVQPYRKRIGRIVKTNLQRIHLIEPVTSDPISKRKQLQAFPPNFIHSLDATHMILSALKCDEVGMSFAAVHDSFWTHAGDIPTLNRILRDAFIRMHSEDIIGRLAAEFSVRYKDHMYLTSVNVKSSAGKKIKSLRLQKPRVRLATAKLEELFMERRRLRLLASSDPLERAEGEAMITPGRIITETAGEEDFVGFEELESIGQTTDETQKLEEDIDISQAADPSFPDFEQDEADAKCVVNTSELQDIDIGQDAFSSFPGFEQGEADMEDVASTSEKAVGKAEENIKPKRPVQQKVWAWMPLSFPPVPKKGDFDVSRLKNSQYFFS